MAVDETTQNIAIREAEERRASFRSILPQSLIETYEARDCIAPFKKEEVSLWKQVHTHNA